MSNIGTANMHMRIEQAFELIDHPVQAWGKQACPFDVFHADGGVSPALRIYAATNSAFCFACGEAFRPVSLLCKAKDLKPEEAAQWILEEVGYIEPDVDDVLAVLMDDVEPELSREDLARALDTYCTRVCPDWDVVQLQERPALAYSRCVSVLDAVQSQADAKRWLEVTKDVMRRTLTSDTPD